MRYALAEAGVATCDVDVGTGRGQASPEFFEMMGLPFPADGRFDLSQWIDRLYPVDAERVLGESRRCARESATYAETYRILRADTGAMRWVQAIGHRVDDSVTGHQRFLMLCWDVTDRKRAEAAARLSDERLRLAMQGFGMGVWEADADAQTMKWSDTLFAMFGCLPSPDQRVPYEWWQTVVHPDDAGKVRRQIEEARRTGLPFVSEYRIRRADTHECRWITGIGRRDIDPYTGHTVATGFAMDVTDRRRAEQALLEADRRKDEFLAVLAHELRNPLAPVANALHLLQMPDLPADGQRHAREIIERQFRQLTRLVDDLLDVSRVVRGLLRLRRERVALAAVLDAAVETARPVIAVRHHELVTDLPPEPVWLDADPVRLAQVFANLLTNSAKYTDPGGRIHMTAGIDGNRLHVTIRDTGIGIAPDMLGRIFDMFAQAKPALERSEGGLGIGLGLARAIIDLHGGRIEASSEGPGRGSEFRVELPLAGAITAAAAPAPADAAPAPPSRLRVLVADDNRDAAESLSMLLELQGHEVRTALGGEEALAAGAAFGPHVALLDIGMPGLNGYEVAARMRTEDWGARALLVAITGWGQAEDKRRAEDAGFDRHLTKPVAFDTLQSLLADAVARFASSRCAK